MTIKVRDFPFGGGDAQKIVMRLAYDIERAYDQWAEWAAPEEYERFETRGEVPVIRGGQRGYEPLETLALKDLPAILDTLVVLEEERRREAAEEKVRRLAERKARERVRAKERRKLKKLGEW